MFASRCRLASPIRVLAPAMEDDGTLVIPGICGRITFRGILLAPMATDRGCIDLDLLRLAFPGKLA